ncbi:MAG: nucleoside deaminase [Sphingobacteriales bacterium]|nr:MAG: nucleoside deaminase [Sphingobacteriales bacterium]
MYRPYQPEAPEDIEDDDTRFMKEALRQARLAYEAGEVPVGAVVVLNNRIIGRGYNQVEQLNDSTAHAEMIALTSAFNQLGAKYLPDATLYVTLEPCLMCCGAMYWSKIGKIVYGASDVKNGYHKTTGDNSPFHPKTVIVHGILEDECAGLMKDFFRALR